MQPKQRLLNRALKAGKTSASARGATDVSPGRHAAHRILELLHGGAANLALIEISPDEPADADAADAGRFGRESSTRLDLEATVAALRMGDSEGAGSLSFHPGLFDYAIAYDALDRLEPGLRLPLLSELRRVSRRGVLLVGPFDSLIVRGVGRLVDIARAANDDYDEPAPAPEFPSLDETKGFFEAHGDDVTVLGDGSLPLWVATRCLSIANPAFEAELRQLESRNRYGPPLGEAEESYKSLLVCLREAPEEGALDAAGRDDSVRLDSGSVAAMLATAALAAELGEVRRQLAAEERRLAGTRATLARRNAQVADLARRLADSLAELAAARGERAIPARDLAAMQKVRAWRLLARLYVATARFRAAIKAPARITRDLVHRTRRRLGGL